MNKKIILCLLGGLLSSHILLAQTQTPGLEQDPASGLLFKDDGNRVQLPFGKTSDRALTGTITVISPEELMEFDNIQDVAEALRGRVPGMMGGINLRGLGDALVLVDGIARPLSTVSLQEIEEITVLKDVNASILYGVQANNGVILIKTKRGRAHNTRTYTWVEHGVSKAVSLPKYLNAADYMELYNEALDNDGLSALYTQELIDATRSGINPLKYPDNDYYSMFLRNTRPVTRAGTEFSGGNENAQYYLNAGWLNSGTLVNVGEGANEKTNEFNLRSNINFRVNHFIKSHLDIAALYHNSRSAMGDFWANASSLHPHWSPLLIDTALVPENASAIVRSAKHLIYDRYLLGGTSQYRTNVYGDLLSGGYNNHINTSAQFTNGIDVDLGSVVKGLSLKTLASFDFYKLFVESQNNSYAVYQPHFTGDDITNIIKVGQDIRTGTQGVSNSGFYRRMSFNGILNYSRNVTDKHALSASAIAFADRYQMTGVRQDQKHVHLGSNINYVFNNRYTVDFSSALVTSAKLPSGNRIGFSPSLALGWIILRDETNPVINFMKIRASGGIMNTDRNIGSYYLHANTFVPGSGVSWNDGARSNSSVLFNNMGNPGLFYEKRQNINLGLEAGLFGNTLWLDANVFHERLSDLIVRRTNEYPAYLGGFVPFTNFGEEIYKGVELGANWRKAIQDFKFSIGANMTYLQTEVVKTDEEWEFDYLYRAGKPVGAIFGLQANGLFNSDSEINGHPTQSFGQVKPGDIRYVDQNGDGIIDQNDEIMLGNNIPKIVGGLNVTFNYKNFTLFGLATGSGGHDRYYTNPYYWIYGSRKYSEVVWNRWTPENASKATYPRLSSQASSNNYRSSSYWLYNSSRIAINRVQLNYDFPQAVTSLLKTQSLAMYVRASNLATIARNSERMELNIGSEPQYRSWSFGIKALF